MAGALFLGLFKTLIYLLSEVPLEGQTTSELGADWERTGSGLGAGCLGVLSVNELVYVNFVLNVLMNPKMFFVGI